MDLNFSADQIELRDAADRFLREQYGKAARENADRAARGFNAEVWSEFARLGWLALPFSEGDGGLGMGSVETAVLLEQFGRHLIVEPYVSSIVLAGSVIAAAGDEVRGALLAGLMDGTRRVSLAHGERGTTLEPASIAARAAPVAEGWQLSGIKTHVVDAAAADTFIVTAKLPNDELAGFLVEAGQVRPALQVFDTVDGRLAAHIPLDGVRLGREARLVARGELAEIIAHAQDRAIAMSAADLVGAMQAALDATVAYTKMRVQFGQPLAANQVVKHRLVEMAVRLEEARSLALAAAIRVGDGSPRAIRERVVSSAKVKVASAGRFVCEQAVQLHGAMGVTDELEIGAYLKRAIAFDAQFGTRTAHLARYQRTPATAA